MGRAALLRCTLMLCALGCAPSERGAKGDSGPPPLATPGTASPTAGSDIAASLVGGCTLSAAPTAADCVFNADREVSLTIEWSAPHLDAPRVIERTAAREHSFEVPYLTSQTAWTWAARSPDAPGELVSGTVETGRVATAPFTTQVSGAAVVEQLAFATLCGASAHLVVMDSVTERLSLSVPLGEAQPESLRRIDGGDWLVLAGPVLWRVDDVGTVLQKIELGALPVHHDATPVQGGYAALVQTDTAVTPLGMRTDDGFAVLDNEGIERATVWLTDVLTPPPDARDDWTHANTIAPSADAGDVLLSLRSQSAIAQVSADPDAADFGAIRWWLGGWDGESGLARPSDFEVVDALGNPEDFRRQHDPSIQDDGRLLLFDNRTSIEVSRALDIRLDPSAGRALVEQVWTLDRHCEFQGGARPTPDGGRLMTCAPRRQVLGFAADQPAAHVWSMSVECPEAGGYLARVWPVSG